MTRTTASDWPLATGEWAVDRSAYFRGRARVASASDHENIFPSRQERRAIIALRVKIAVGRRTDPFAGFNILDT